MGRLVGRMVACVWLLWAGVSCGGAGADADTAHERQAAVERRLAGGWQLLSFVPDTALDPTLQALLASQAGQLTVRFERGRVRCTTPGINFDRAYRIAETGERFQLLIVDEQGLTSENWGEFDSAGRLTFRCMTDPWKGTGVLQREGAPQ